MTSPSATVSEYCSSVLTSKPFFSSAASASSASSPVKSLTVDRLAALADEEVDDRAGLQGLCRPAGRCAAPCPRARSPTSGRWTCRRPGGRRAARPAPRPRSCPIGARHVVALLAERDDRRDGAAVEDPLPGPGVGGEHAARGHRLGVRRVADLDVEAGGLELALGAAAGPGRGRRGRRCSGPSRTTTRRRRRRRRAAGRAGAAEDRAATDAAGRALVIRATCAGGGTGSALDRGRAVDDLAEPRRARRPPGVISRANSSASKGSGSVSLDRSSRARGDRRGVGGDRPRGAGRRSARRPRGRRRAGPGRPGAPGGAARRRRPAAGRGRARWRARPARRRTPGVPGTSRDGGGTSSWTCL